MDIFYVIQNIKTKEYYSTYSSWNGFDANINEAYKFNNKQDAINEMLKEDLKEVFSNKHIRIIKIYYQTEL